MKLVFKNLKAIYFPFPVENIASPLGFSLLLSLSESMGCIIIIIHLTSYILL